MDAGNQRRQALVLGSGIAGLLAARVLADYFEHVTIVERDHFPDDTAGNGAYRSGVPQSRHAHGLLMCGLEIMERLFPGFTAELDAAGAPRVEWMRETIQLVPTGWTPRYPSGIVTRGCSRALLEKTLRCRVATLPNVSFQQGSTVAGLITNPDQTRVIGVRLEARHADHDDILRADFVLDATGRSSHAPQWLTEIGYAAPEETVVDAHLGYATRVYHLPEQFQPDWKALLIMTRPSRPRGGVFQKIEGGRWMMTLAGTAGDYPPTDEQGLRAFAASIPAPPLHEALALAEPLSPIYGYRSTANRWRHYEKLARFPAGFAVIGDAACVFNPVYGQGMTAAAVGVEVLDQCLRANIGGLQFQRRLARSSARSWLMATTEDYRYPTEGAPPSAVVQWRLRYLDWLFAAAPDLPEVTSTFLGVMHLMSPVTVLFRPALIARRLAYGLRRKEKPIAQPAVGKSV